MKTHEYKLRMPIAVAEATSANVTAWIEDALANGITLKADPGAGRESIALRLDKEKVIALANKKNEREHVVLRRLLATKCDLPPAEPKEKSAGTLAAEVIPDKILPVKLRYTPEDCLKVVRGMDKGLAWAYRKGYGLKELPAAETPEENRELATQMAECVNRRAPKWAVENADLLKLGFAFIGWGTAQADDLDRRVADQRGPRPPKLKVVTPAKPAEEVSQTQGPAEVESDIFAEPVQLEGQF